MYLVKANNLLNSRSFSAKFESEIEANEWLQERLNKNSWGRPARQAVKDQDAYDESLVISEFEDTQDELDENGNTIQVSRTIVSLRAEYDYSVEEIDLLANNDDAKEERLRVATEKANQYRVFKDFGEKVELYFTALINERNYTQEQKDSVQANADVLAVLGQLKFGRVAKAKGMVDAIVADEDLFFEADLDNISLLMADFLEKYPLEE